MSIDLFVVTPYAEADLRPSLLGLGEGPFVWPDADRFDGFTYPNRHLDVSRYVDDTPDGIAARIRELAPPSMRTILSLYLRDYRDGFEGNLAAALDGFATTDALVYSELWGEALDEAADADTRAYARAAVLYTVPDEPYRTQAKLSVRGAFWGDRFAPGTPEADRMIAHAVRDVPGALDVLLFWTGKGREGGVPRGDRFDGDHLQRKLLAELASVSRAPVSVLELFVGPRGVVDLEPSVLELLVRVIEPPAMRAFLARRDRESAKREEQQRFLEDAKSRGDFI